MMGELVALALRVEDTFRQVDCPAQRFEALWADLDVVYCLAWKGGKRDFHAERALYARLCQHPNFPMGELVRAAIGLVPYALDKNPAWGWWTMSLPELEDARLSWLEVYHQCQTTRVEHTLVYRRTYTVNWKLTF